jgi:iron complex transport system substrate-binding protein
MPGLMLKELGAEHLAERYPSLLDELSMEIILKDDPEYIFIVTMGDSEEALNAFDQQMAESPAWSELTAVKEGHCYVLPKELFHFKPNARWAESYAWLSEILYPGLSPELRPAIEESVLK